MNSKSNKKLISFRVSPEVWEKLLKSLGQKQTMSGLISEIVEESLSKDPYKLPDSFSTRYAQVKDNDVIIEKDNSNNCYQVSHTSGRYLASIHEYRDFVAGFLLGVHKDNL